MQNEGTPPDSRTGSTLPTMEAPDGRQVPYDHPDLLQQGQPMQQPPLQATGETAEPPLVGSKLQMAVGNDRFFEFVDFASTQHYLGVNIDEMDRLDLLGLAGMLIGDVYQTQARLNAVQKQQDVYRNSVHGTVAPTSVVADHGQPAPTHLHANPGQPQPQVRPPNHQANLAPFVKNQQLGLTDEELRNFNAQQQTDDGSVAYGTGGANTLPVGLKRPG